MAIASVTIKLTDGTTLTIGDGTTAPSPAPIPTTGQSGPSVDFGGYHWTFGGPAPDNDNPLNLEILRDGAPTGGGGTRYYATADALYLETAGHGWYKWNPNSTTTPWVPSTNPTLGQPQTPPATPPVDPAPPVGSTFKLNGPLPRLFPASSAWNTRIDKAAVHPQSAAIIKAIPPAYAPSGRRFQNDFGNGMGIPYAVGHGFTPVPIKAGYADETDPGPYPIPLNAPTESGSDKHILFLDDSTNKLYEMETPARYGSGFSCLSGAIWDLTKGDDQRPLRWTSADAAGLPILPGLVRVDEMAAALAQPNVADQHLGHALRFTLDLGIIGRAFVPPARHYASFVPYSLPDHPPMGMRIRVNPNLDLSPFNQPTQVLLRTLQLYGAILADNGKSFFVTGTDDPAWSQWFDAITSTTDGFKSVAGALFDDNVQVLDFKDSDVVKPE